MMASRLLPWSSRAASYLRISTFYRGFATVFKDLKYADTHEWVRVDGTSATVGITDHAQDHLGDIVYVELPEVGATVRQGKNFCVVESGKTTTDIHSPVSGEIVGVNTELSESPGLIIDDIEKQLLLMEDWRKPLFSQCQFKPGELQTLQGAPLGFVKIKMLGNTTFQLFHVVLLIWG